MHPAFATMVDYAGLFPPAACSMEEAVAHYAEYRQSGDRWMLGRFVVGAARLGELVTSVERQGLVPDPEDPWQLSVVVGPDHDLEMARIAELAAGRLGEVLRVAAVEVRVAAAEDVPVVAGRVAGTWEIFLEVPHLTVYAPLIEAIASVGAMAKLRTGGTAPDAFPASRVVARFLEAAVRAGVAFKATAGLHHPWRGHYPLSYEAGAPSGEMYGFMAVLVATAALRAGAGSDIAQAILEEEDASAFESRDGGIVWRDLQLSAGELAAARRLAFRGFGSCSFREPVDELALEVGR